MRLALLGKRKGELQKGYTTNWIRELFTVFKIKVPKDSETKSYLFCVKDDETGKIRQDAQKNAIPYTMNDLMVVDGDPEKPPEDIQFKEKVGTETRSAKKDKAEESEPVLKKEPEPDKPPPTRKSTRKTKPPSTQP